MEGCALGIPSVALSQAGDEETRENYRLVARAKCMARTCSGNCWMRAGPTAP